MFETMFKTILGTDCPQAVSIVASVLQRWFSLSSPAEPLGSSFSLLTGHLDGGETCFVPEVVNRLPDGVIGYRKS
jgi:hypothetical protein